MFTLHLSKNYKIICSKETSYHSIKLFCDDVIVGHATFITDDVDVSCVTDIHINPEHIATSYDNQHTIGMAFLKLFQKFPSQIRKPEFRFIFNPPQTMLALLESSHFIESTAATHPNDFMIGFPSLKDYGRDCPEGIVIERNSTYQDHNQILRLLQKSAYWQTHLSEERLVHLLHHSLHFVVRESATDDIVGFARVVTDGRDFASLWDVVVDTAHQKQGIGKHLMFEIFSSEAFKSVKQWLLFTDTAAHFYEKFGFFKAHTASAASTFFYKLRLQVSYPDYMTPLNTVLEKWQCTQQEKTLSISQTNSFLFEQKRKMLPLFWKTLQKDQRSDHLKLPILDPSASDCQARR